MANRNNKGRTPAEESAYRREMARNMTIAASPGSTVGKGAAGLAKLLLNRRGAANRSAAASFKPAKPSSSYRPVSDRYMGR